MLDGVKEFSASYHKLQMALEYNETKPVDEQNVAAVIKKDIEKSGLDKHLLMERPQRRPLLFNC